MIISSKFSPDSYDKTLADKLSAFMPGRAQKLVKHSDLANVNRAAARGINYRLAENGFIDNGGDLQKFNEYLDDLARIYLESFGIKASNSAPVQQAPAKRPTKQATETESFGGRYRCTVFKLNVRSAPSLSGSVVASYSRGQTVVLDDWYKSADGFIWGRYTGGSGKIRYVAVGRATGKPEADDYLVRE